MKSGMQKHICCCLLSLSKRSTTRGFISSLLATHRTLLSGWWWTDSQVHACNSKKMGKRERTAIYIGGNTGEKRGRRQQDNHRREAEWTQSLPVNHTLRQRYSFLSESDTSIRRYSQTTNLTTQATYIKRPVSSLDIQLYTHITTYPMKYSM